MKVGSKVGRWVGRKKQENRIINLGKRSGQNWGENGEKILEIISKDVFVTISDISKSLDISTTAVENNISKLKKKGLLKRVGPAKGGYWEIVEKDL